MKTGMRMTDDGQVLLVVSLGVTVPAYHRAYHSKETKHVFLQTYREIILTEESFINTGIQSFVTGSMRDGTKFKNFQVF